MEREGILTSTGGVGIEERSGNRLYWNWGEEPINTPECLIGSLRQLTMRGEMRGKTRVVFRGLVSRGVIETIFKNSDGVVRNLEVAFPIDGDSEEVWFLMFGRNASQRRNLTPVGKMIKETSIYRKEPEQISRRLNNLLCDGYLLKDSLDSDDATQVFTLWGETFGWTSGQVMNLSTILLQQQKLPSNERFMWFSGVERNGLLVSIATAERLPLKTQNGDLDIVESTEWKTREGFENRGLATSAIAYLNTQIFHALPHSLVIAECNFQSRSDRAAHGAGFVVPRRSVNGITVPQILVQNVAVQDGHEPTGLRDFTFMYIPKDLRERLYAEDEISCIMELVKKN